MTTDATHIKAKALVYAEVLLEAAKASDKVFAITGEFDELLATVRGSFDLRNALTDPAISPEAKKAIVSEVFDGFAPELLSTFDVMVDRGDLPTLSRAHENYIELAEKALSAVILDVTTVVPLDDNLRQQIISKYSAQFGSGVLLREHIDTSLIGGIVLSTHGKRIDASVSSQLENARHTLSKTY